jgi:hypothetical protein
MTMGSPVTPVTPVSYLKEIESSCGREVSVYTIQHQETPFPV